MSKLKKNDLVRIKPAIAINRAGRESLLKGAIGMVLRSESSGPLRRRQTALVLWITGKMYGRRHLFLADDLELLKEGDE